MTVLVGLQTAPTGLVPLSSVVEVLVGRVEGYASGAGSDHDVVDYPVSAFYE